MPRLANKVALITGAAGGQGTAEAELFVREGAAIVLSDIDAAVGERLAKRLTEQGGKALFRVQDVASEEGWKEVVAAALSAFGGLQHPGQQCRHDRSAGDRRYDTRGVEPHGRRKPDRRAPRHETLRAGDQGFGRRVDRQHLVDRGADGA